MQRAGCRGSPSGCNARFSRRIATVGQPKKTVKGHKPPSAVSRSSNPSQADAIPAGSPWIVLLVVAVAVLPFLNSFSAPFVFDDNGSVAGNPYLKQLWPLSAAMGAPIQSALAGRPIVALSFALNHALAGGLQPAAFRIGNLAIHLGVGALLFGLVVHTLRCSPATARFRAAATPIASVSALLWLIHPLNTEVIDYLTQRTESMMALFYLSTLYAAMRAMTSSSATPRRAWTGAAVLACAFGMASKESMATAPLMVLLYDLSFNRDASGRPLKTRWSLYAGLVATLIVLVVLLLPGPRSHSAGFASGVSPWTYFLNQPDILLRYLRLVVWPQGLVLDYGVPRNVPWQSALPAALVIGALAGATLVAWTRRRDLAFLGTWCFVTLAPTSSFLPIATEAGAERRMYLPLMALIVLAVASAWRVIERVVSTPAARRWTAAAASAAVATLLGGFTIERNAEYHSPTGIWQTVLDRRPHGRAHYNLGILLKEQGNRTEAMRHYQLAVSDEPGAHYAVGFELDADGKTDEAISHYREFIRLKPEDINVIRAYVLMGIGLKRTGRLEEASVALKEALARQPNNRDAKLELADLAITQGRNPEAFQLYTELARSEPRDFAVQTGLGIALAQGGRTAEAVTAFTAALALNPSDSGSHVNLGNALANVGRYEEAERSFRQAVALAPRFVRARNQLALVLMARGMRNEALREFQESFRLDPSNPETRDDFATAFPGAPLPPVTR